MDEIQNYISEKKELYDILLIILEDTEDNINDFEELIDHIELQNFHKNTEEFNHFLQLIDKLSCNHHRNEYFLQKINRILQQLGNLIKHVFTNLEIFNIFKNNKIILHILFESGILIYDECIHEQICELKLLKGDNYYLFFYTQIKNYIGEEQMQNIIKEIPNFDFTILDDIDQKCKIGENDSYICQLIRQDLVIEFIIYVNESNISLLSIIKSSVFETNSYLIDSKVTLIEYAAFFGSIQIFQYLLLNKVELTPSIWLYAIHGRNPEIIQILESYNIHPPNDEYERCFIESIKCHHNDFANYIEDNYIDQNDINSKNKINLREKIISTIFKYHNYSCFPTDFNENYVFFYLNLYHFSNIVNLLILKNEEEIKKIINICK